MRVRYYNPVTGRYISRDPMGYGDGLNVYCYVHNNPINRIDPLGLFDLWEAAKGIGGGLVQGALNVVNGAQDGIVGIVNLPGRGFNALGGNVGMVPSPDWSKDAVVSSDVYSHDLSKGIGGGGALTLATGGVGLLAKGANVVDKLDTAVTAVEGAVKVATGDASGLIDLASSALGVVPGGGKQPSPESPAFHAPGDLPDSAVVVRGGTNLPAQFTKGSGVTSDADGVLSDISVNSSAYGHKAAEMPAGIIQGKMGVTTVGDVRAMGGNVVPRPTQNNPFHSLMEGVQADPASDLFRQGLRDNPNKKK